MFDFFQASPGTIRMQACKAFIHLKFIFLKNYKGLIAAFFLISKFFINENSILHNSINVVGWKNENKNAIFITPLFFGR